MSAVALCVKERERIGKRGADWCDVICSAIETGI